MRSAHVYDITELSSPMSYLCPPPATLPCVNPVEISDNGAMETPWQRLHSLAEARRMRLNLTQAGVAAVGGPSPAWIRKLPHMSGEPNGRHLSALKSLDAALRWPEGTSLDLIARDRSAWSRTQLKEEERGLIDMMDELSHFGFIVEHRMRAIPPSQRDDVMRQILKLLGIG